MRWWVETSRTNYDSRVSRGVTFWSAAVTALVALWVTLAFALGAGCVDDAYIYLRYASNLVAGRGPVFNPGERVEGYTSPVWLLVTAGLTRFLPDAGAVLPIASAVVGFSAVLLILGWTDAPVARRTLAAFALAVNPAYVFWCWSGMETALLSVFVLAAWMLAARAPTTRSGCAVAGLAFTAAVLTRPDAVWLLPFLIYPLYSSQTSPRERLSSLLAYSAPLVLIFVHLLWRYSYYDAWLPNTFTAKVSGSGLGAAVNGLRYAWNCLLILAPTLALGVLWRPRAKGNEQRSDSSRGLAAALWWLVATVLVGGDHFPLARLLVPVLPVAALVFAHHGVHSPKTPGEHSIGALLLASSVLVIFAPEGRAAASEVALARHWSVAGQWLRDGVRQDCLLATPVAGAIPFHSGLPTVDMLGLTDRTVAREGRVQETGTPGHLKSATEYVLRRRPDVVVLAAPGPAGEPAYASWPRAMPAVHPALFAVGDLLARPETQHRYQYRWRRLSDGAAFEWLERSESPGCRPR